MLLTLADSPLRKEFSSRDVYGFVTKFVCIFDSSFSQASLDQKVVESARAAAHIKDTPFGYSKANRSASCIERPAFQEKSNSLLTISEQLSPIISYVPVFELFFFFVRGSL
jgi:hypothetical protein